MPATAAALLVAVAVAAAQEDGSLDAPLPAVRKVRVPVENVVGLLDGERTLRPMPEAELDRLLADADLARSQPAAGPVAATVAMTFNPDTWRLQGTAEWDWPHPVRRLTLAPISPVVEQLGAAGGAVRWGATAPETLSILAEAASEPAAVNARWWQDGTRGADGVSFDLRLPACAVARWSLALPQGWTLRTPIAAVAADPSDPTVRVWSLAPAGESRVTLRIVRERSTPVASGGVDGRWTFRFDGQEVRFGAELEFADPAGAEAIDLLLDSRFVPETPVSTPPLSWQRSGAGSLVRWRGRFRERPTQTVRLKLSGTVAAGRGRWVQPTVAYPGCRFYRETVSWRWPDRLRLKDFDPGPYVPRAAGAETVAVDADRSTEREGYRLDLRREGGVSADTAVGRPWLELVASDPTAGPATLDHVLDLSRTPSRLTVVARADGPAKSCVVTVPAGWRPVAAAGRQTEAGMAAIPLVGSDGEGPATGSTTFVPTGEAADETLGGRRPLPIAHLAQATAAAVGRYDVVPPAKETVEVSGVLPRDRTGVHALETHWPVTAPSRTFFVPDGAEPHYRVLLVESPPPRLLRQTVRIDAGGTRSEYVVDIAAASAERPLLLRSAANLCRLDWRWTDADGQIAVDCLATGVPECFRLVVPVGRRGGRLTAVSDTTGWDEAVPLAAPIEGSAEVVVRNPAGRAVEIVADGLRERPDKADVWWRASWQPQATMPSLRLRPMVADEAETPPLLHLTVRTCIAGGQVYEVTDLRIDSPGGRTVVPVLAGAVAVRSATLDGRPVRGRLVGERLLDLPPLGAGRHDLRVVHLRRPDAPPRWLLQAPRPPADVTLAAFRWELFSTGPMIALTDGWLGPSAAAPSAGVTAPFPGSETVPALADARPRRVAVLHGADAVARGGPVVLLDAEAVRRFAAMLSLLLPLLVVVPLHRLDWRRRRWLLAVLLTTLAAVVAVGGLLAALAFNALVLTLFVAIVLALAPRAWLRPSAALGASVLFAVQVAQAQSSGQRDRPVEPPFRVLIPYRSDGDKVTFQQALVPQALLDRLRPADAADPAATLMRQARYDGRVTAEGTVLWQATFRFLPLKAGPVRIPMGGKIRRVSVGGTDVPFRIVDRDATLEFHPPAAEEADESPWRQGSVVLEGPVDEALVQLRIPPATRTEYRLERPLSQGPVEVIQGVVGPLGILEIPLAQPPGEPAAAPIQVMHGIDWTATSREVVSTFRLPEAAGVPPALRIPEGLVLRRVDLAGPSGPLPIEPEFTALADGDRRLDCRIQGRPAADAEVRELRLIGRLAPSADGRLELRLPQPLDGSAVKGRVGVRTPPEWRTEVVGLRNLEKASAAEFAAGMQQAGFLRDPAESYGHRFVYSRQPVSLTLHAKENAVGAEVRQAAAVRLRHPMLPLEIDHRVTAQAVPTHSLPPVTTWRVPEGVQVVAVEGSEVAGYLLDGRRLRILPAAAGRREISFRVRTRTTATGGGGHWRLLPLRPQMPGATETAVDWQVSAEPPWSVAPDDGTGTDDRVAASPLSPTVSLASDVPFRIRAVENPRPLEAVLTSVVGAGDEPSEVSVRAHGTVELRRLPPEGFVEMRFPSGWREPTFGDAAVLRTGERHWRWSVPPRTLPAVLRWQAAVDPALLIEPDATLDAPTIGDGRASYRLRVEPELRDRFAVRTGATLESDNPWTLAVRASPVGGSDGTIVPLRADVHVGVDGVAGESVWRIDGPVGDPVRIDLPPGAVPGWLRLDGRTMDYSKPQPGRLLFRPPGIGRRVLRLAWVAESVASVRLPGVVGAAAVPVPVRLRHSPSWRHESSYPPAAWPSLPGEPADAAAGPANVVALPPEGHLGVERAGPVRIGWSDRQRRWLWMMGTLLAVLLGWSRWLAIRKYWPAALAAAVAVLLGSPADLLAGLLLLTVAVCGSLRNVLEWTGPRT